MAADPLPETCERVSDPPCPGVRIPGSDACLAHLAPVELDQFLQRLTGSDFDFRGTTISAALLERLLDAVRGPDGGVALREARFDHAEIEGADFTGVRFVGDASFTEARFGTSAIFNEARFDGNAVFLGVQFRGEAELNRTLFSQQALFGETQWSRGAVFTQARFLNKVSFNRAEVNGTLDFRDAIFDDSIDLGLVRAELLQLTDALFEQSVHVNIDALDVFCNGARFAGGLNLTARYAKIEAIRTVFGGPSSIASPAGRFHMSWNDEPAWVRLGFEREQPRLLAVHDADVSNLVLVDMDLSLCAFTGAHRLDQLRIEGRCQFNTPPSSWRWTNRQLIAEEAHWRGWPVQYLNVEGGASPARLAAVYRSLRKALEDSKNEAGAGDFYYGEMEMRRHSTETRRAERWILSAYWLFSGYGQRAGRALAALLSLIATVGVLLVAYGQPVGEAAKIAVGAVVLREAGTELTTAGEWTVMVARFLGPVLLALAVLAVRARVKR